MGKYTLKIHIGGPRIELPATLVRSSNTDLLHVPKWIYTQCTNHITSNICKSLDITDYLVLKKVNRHDVIGIELISCIWGKVLLG